MTRRELIEYCMSKPGAYEDYPFDKLNDGTSWTVMRHSGNRKTFALIFERQGGLWINLKCEPMLAELLRSAYQSVLPGYHMNKAHWNSVIVGGDLPEERLLEMIDHSFELTKPKAPRRIRPDAP
ncbi:MmcQ/YjbR family DNA-binding protein [Clostridiaceae bacterium NSJ-31]|uniref:MmcQ/YjbR family DNA-binding protein n=1 Tax=Ligaoa zhengdingensis TaxID=2763658 RepID=A0A926E1G9_9FIRM|nr:MmcQ/YjbR family DNA-binding protein [Ligaoa zhengdingensis]MBC8547389.1 MmcQ/YjbR family DNA-binding protein [Ligaoa zhengdingensis]